MADGHLPLSWCHVIGLLIGAFMLFPSIAVMVYFTERLWLLIRAKDQQLNVVLDQDLFLGRQLYVSLRGLFVPPDLF